MGSPGCPLAYTGPSCSSHASSSFSLPSLVFLLSLNPTEGMEATEEDTGAMEDTEVMVATEDTMAKDLPILSLQLNPQRNLQLNLLLTRTMEDMAMEDMEDMEDTMEDTVDTVVMVAMAMGVMAKDPLSLLQQPLHLLILTTDMVDTMEATEAMVVMAMGATMVKHSCCENFGLAWT